MAIELENGIGDYFSYAIVSSQQVLNDFLQAYRDAGIGTAYGPECGWSKSHVPEHLDIPVITPAVLREALEESKSHKYRTFEDVLFAKGYIVDDDSEDDEEDEEDEED